MTEFEKRDDGWWFTFGGEHYGPYATKAEAEDDQRGLRRFERHHKEPGYVTGDKPA